jgi:outer membrane protein assembly factor BamE (lipoprotein component of BamABCDE complex)
MRNLLIIFVLTLGLTSCDPAVKTIDDVRQVKVGSTQIEVLYLLGEPYEIDLEVGYEEWKYRLETDSRYHNTFTITITNEKVTNYTTY